MNKNYAEIPSPGTTPRRRTKRTGLKFAVVSLVVLVLFGGVAYRYTFPSSSAASNPNYVSTEAMNQMLAMNMYANVPQYSSQMNPAAVSYKAQYPTTSRSLNPMIPSSAHLYRQSFPSQTMNMMTTGRSAMNIPTGANHQNIPSYLKMSPNTASSMYIPSFGQNHEYQVPPPVNHLSTVTQQQMTPHVAQQNLQAFTKMPSALHAAMNTQSHQFPIPRSADEISEITTSNKQTTSHQNPTFPSFLKMPSQPEM